MRTAILAFLILAATVTPVQASPAVEQVIVERAEAHGVSPWALRQTLGCETGWTWNRWAVGASGELGIAQLHPYGLLPTFFAYGYSDPYSVWQAVDFTAVMFAQGMATHWSCYWTRVLGSVPPWW
ncbi:MAG: hypothetical protein GEU71_03540 [Actinobacteria bacterium]|nr:hypothetical protein [Actinomycetota bacterium]